MMKKNIKSDHNPAPYPHTDDPSEHILTCLTCGQSFDVREGVAVIHHSGSHHQPQQRN